MTAAERGASRNDLTTHHPSVFLSRRSRSEFRGALVDDLEIPRGHIASHYSPWRVADELLDGLTVAQVEREQFLEREEARFTQYAGAQLCPPTVLPSRDFLTTHPVIGARPQRLTLIQTSVTPVRHFE